MTTRRAVLVGGAAVLAGVIAACTRAVRAAPTSVPSSAAAPTSSAPAPTSDASTAASTASPTPISTLMPTSTRTSPVRPSPSPSPTPTRPTSPSSSSPSPASTGPAQAVGHGPRTADAVALTFHGQGDPDLARQILAIAAAHRAEITVMAVGTWLEDQPEMAKAILAGGHELGNHTWSHGDINSMDSDQARAEITRCRDRLIALTGSPGRYFRQSQSPTATAQVLALAGAAGYRIALSYDIDSLDWTDPGVDAVREATAAATGGSIVSMHLGHAVTIDALPGVLADLAARRLRAVTVSQLLRM